jgi:hypothetical protein
LNGLIERVSLEQAQAWLDGLTFPVTTANVEPMRAVGRALLIELRLNRAFAAGGPRAHSRFRGAALAKPRGPGHTIRCRSRHVRSRWAARCRTGWSAVLPEDLFEAGCALDSVAPREGVITAGRGDRAQQRLVMMQLAVLQVQDRLIGKPKAAIGDGVAQGMGSLLGTGDDTGQPIDPRRRPLRRSNGCC